jgi:hypothetical protein
VVSRYDRDVLDAAFPQTSDNAAYLGPDRRAQLKRAAELIVYRDHHDRVAFAVRVVEYRFHLSR